MRTAKTIMVTVILMLITCVYGHAARQSSASFQLSLTVDKTVHSNIVANSKTNTTTATHATSTLTATHEIQFEEITRNYKEATLKTIVVK